MAGTLLTRLASFTLIALGLGGGVSPVRAWSWEGHKIVAQIAERHLSHRARDEIDRLLTLQGRRSMTEIASWADSVRELAFLKLPNHTVRLPLDESLYDEKRDCRARRCLIAGIEDTIDTLKNKESSQEAKAVALNYLVHLVGDVHQPLHATIDNGDRLILVGGKERTLHFFWDREVVNCHQTDWSVLAEKIDSSVQFRATNSGPAGWAAESRDIARDIIFKDVKTASTPVEIRSDYCQYYWPTVSLQLKKAGMRLSDQINSIFPN